MVTDKGVDRFGAAHPVVLEMARKNVRDAVSRRANVVDSDGLGHSDTQYKDGKGNQVSRRDGLNNHG